MADPTRNWLDLPSELTANILHRLGAIQILESAQKVCTSWRKICKDPAMWRIIDMRNFAEVHTIRADLDIMCRHAVDRSEGQLIDINIEYFDDLELLDYIVERSSQLRRLQISCCYHSLYGSLGKAVKKLPLLEELSLNLTDISKEDIEIVGRSCPRLKSFNLNAEWNKFSHIWDSPCNSEALAIAENMPKLLHLQLIGNKMTDTGLEAILDGCDQLESLDLRRCNNLKFEGSLGKRCSEQIKGLKRPNESLKDCRFTFEDHGVAFNYDYYDSDGDSYGGGYYNDRGAGIILPCGYSDMTLDDDDDDDDDDNDDYNDDAALDHVYDPALDHDDDYDPALDHDDDLTLDLAAAVDALDHDDGPTFDHDDDYDPALDHDDDLTLDLAVVDDDVLDHDDLTLDLVVAVDALDHDDDPAFDHDDDYDPALDHDDDLTLDLYVVDDDVLDHDDDLTLDLVVVVDALDHDDDPAFDHDDDYDPALDHDDDLTLDLAVVDDDVLDHDDDPTLDHVADDDDALDHVVDDDPSLDHDDDYDPALYSGYDDFNNYGDYDDFNSYSGYDDFDSYVNSYDEYDESF